MFKKLIFLILFVSLFTSSFAFQQLIDTKIQNHNVKVINIVIDLDHKIVVSVSNTGENLTQLMKKVGGISAVNGAYFCPADYKNCNGKNYTNAPRFLNGKNLSKYGEDFGVNGVFAFDNYGDSFLVANPIWGDIPKNIKSYNVTKIKDIYNGLGNFPILLINGNSILKHYGNLIDKKMQSKGIKNFICSTKDGKHIYMGYISNISIYELPTFLKTNFNCHNAINLDSGGSLGMIYNNKIIKKNSRPIMDAFVVVKRTEQEKRNIVLKKYYNLINKVVLKIKSKLKYNKRKIKLAVKKIEKIKNKYKSKNFVLYVMLDEIEKKLK